MNYGGTDQNLTLPRLAELLGITRSKAERIVSQYSTRLPDPERVGITRIWPCEVLVQMKAILEEERRCSGGDL